MPPTNMNLKKAIMRRVYMTWFWRSVAPLLGVEAILLAGVLVGVFTHISVRHILMNALGSSADIRAFFMFFVSNFLVKSIQSQLLVVAFGALALLFTRDIRRAFERLKSFGAEGILASSAFLGNQR